MTAARVLSSRSLSSRILAGIAITIMIASAGCGQRPISYLDRLHSCTSSESPIDAYCGMLSVFENRQTKTGRRISLNIVLLPAVANTPKPDPLFFLAGGPGQGAAQMAREIREAFRRIQRDRDIVLVDQRGTGKSNPLDCRDPQDHLRDALAAPEDSMPRLRTCLAGYDADVRLYTTPIAMDDLDDVRAYLGYGRLNLYGGSYGTRAALVYMRQHGDRVRAAILDSVAPTDMRLPMFAARDAQRALDKLLADCDADARCHGTFPDLSGRIRALMQRLEKRPVHARIVHPRTGMAEDVDIRAQIVASILFGALYSPATASIVPMLVDRAEHNEFQSLLALAFAGGAGENMSVGMQLSVLCSEDAGRFTAADVARATAGTVFGDHLLVTQIKACEFWPRGTVDAAYYEPVVSDVPTLVLSGDLDPVTPPTWGQSVAEHLSHAMHVQVAGSGHGVTSTACGKQLVQTFLDRGTTEGLDTSCAKTTHRPPFFVSPAGPDPGVSDGASSP
jgi:pimeloyl-ACP methyl ester carboxylesterase